MARILFVTLLVLAGSARADVYGFSSPTVETIFTLRANDGVSDIAIGSVTQSITRIPNGGAGLINPQAQLDVDLIGILITGANIREVSISHRDVLLEGTVPGIEEPFSLRIDQYEYALVPNLSGGFVVLNQSPVLDLGPPVQWSPHRFDLDFGGTFDVGSDSVPYDTSRVDQTCPSGSSTCFVTLPVFSFAAIDDGAFAGGGAVMIEALSNPQGLLQTRTLEEPIASLDGIDYRVVIENRIQSAEFVPEPSATLLSLGALAALLLGARRGSAPRG